eukprot:7381242-Prymnesium_polylepis.1
MVISLRVISLRATVISLGGEYHPDGLAPGATICFLSERPVRPNRPARAQQPRSAPEHRTGRYAASDRAPVRAPRLTAPTCGSAAAARSP